MFYGFYNDESKMENYAAETKKQCSKIEMFEFDVPRARTQTYHKVGTKSETQKCLECRLDYKNTQLLKLSLALTYACRS